MRKLGTFVLAGALACGAALAQQKPPPLGAPEPAPMPTGKPAPLGAAPRAPVAIPADEPAAVTRLRGLLGGDVTMSYRSAETTDAARGAVRLLDVVLEQPGKRATIAELTLDNLREDGVDEAVLRDVVIEEGAKRMAADRLQLTGLTVRRPPGGGSPTPDQFSADAIRVEGLRVQDEAEIAIASFSLEDYGPGRQSRVALSGLEIGMAPGEAVETIRLGRLVMRGVDLAMLAGAAAIGKVPPAMAGRSALEVDEVTFGAGGQSLGGIASIRMTNDADATGSGTGSLAIRGVRVEPFPGLAEWLQRFGYQALVADLTMEGRYDSGTGRVDVSALSLSGRDIGALSLAFAMDGITPEAAAMRDPQNMRLISASLRYADQSLYQRFLRQQAREMGMSEAQLRDQYAAMAGGMLTQPGKTGLDPVREAVTRFMRGQAREVEIAIRPPQPLSLSTLQDRPPGGPAEIQRMLGLTATAR